MSLSMQVNQYWQLGRVMLLPTRFLRWLFTIIFSLIALGGIFTPQGKEIFLAVGAGVSFLLLSIIGMQIPGQMLALGSSKQFRCLADLRGKLFAISFVFWLSAALISCSFFYNLSTHNFTFWDMLSLAVAATSFIATTFTIIIARYPPALAIYPIFFFIVLPEFFKKIILTGEIESLYLWAGSVILWAVFYIWWLNWQPKKFFSNTLDLSSSELRQRIEEDKSTQYKFSSSPRTLGGSLLFGASDGFLLWIQREVIQPIIFLGLGMAFILWRDISPEKIPVMFAIGFIFIIVVARGGYFLQLLHSNLHRLWMNTNHSRIEIFSKLESFYFPAFIASRVPTLFFIALVNHFFFDDLINSFYFGYILLTATLCVSCSYYLGMLIYSKFTARTMLVGWILMIAYACLITGMIFFNLFWGWDVSQNHADYLCYSGLLAVLTILFRQWAKSSWKRVNFYRARS